MFVPTTVLVLDMVRRIVQPALVIVFRVHGVQCSKTITSRARKLRCFRDQTVSAARTIPVLNKAAVIRVVSFVVFILFCRV